VAEKFGREVRKKSPGHRQMAKARNLHLSKPKPAPVCCAWLMGYYPVRRPAIGRGPETLRETRFRSTLVAKKSKPKRKTAFRKSTGTGAKPTSSARESGGKAASSARESGGTGASSARESGGRAASSARESGGTAASSARESGGKAASSARESGGKPKKK
jgi:hypothetical protein